MDVELACCELWMLDVRQTEDDGRKLMLEQVGEEPRHMADNKWTASAKGANRNMSWYTAVFHGNQAARELCT